MKIRQIIPPVAALLVVLAWNLMQRRELMAQRDNSEDLRSRLDEAKTAGQSRKAVTTRSSVNSQQTNGPIDWEGLSARLNDLRSGTAASDVQEMAALKKQMAAMNREDILAALDRISAMGLSDKERRSLEELLIAPLVAVDPELALERFAGHIREGGPGVIEPLAAALQSWAGQDPKAASSWLDSQIQAGVFDSLSLDGRSDARLEFEASLLGELLALDPAEASRRLAALPEDQRREVLEPIFFAGLDADAQRAYVALVRDLVPKSENAGSLVHIIAELVPEGGYETVDAFFNLIGATNEERAVSARQAANSQLGLLAAERPLTREDVDAMRTWLKTYAPDDVETVTGRALGEVVQDGGKLSFQEASDLVLDYQKSSGNDEALVAFLRSFAARSNVEQATSLAALIKDPALRQKILDEIH